MSYIPKPKVTHPRAARNKLGTMTRFAFDRLLELALPTAAAAVPKRESRTRSTEGEHVDDGDLLGAPAEGPGALDEGVLALCGFLVLLDLSGRGLTNVNEGGAAQMVGLDSAVSHRCYPPR